MMATLVGEFYAPCAKDSVTEARHQVKKLVEQVLGYGDRADDTVLCAGELITNSAIHSGGTFMHIAILDGGDRVRVEVTDSGVEPIKEADDDPMAEHGRGLLIVRALADRHGVIQDERGTTFWLEARRPLQEPPQS